MSICSLQLKSINRLQLVETKITATIKKWNYLKKSRSQNNKKTKELERAPTIFHLGAKIQKHAIALVKSSDTQSSTEIRRTKGGQNAAKCTIAFRYTQEPTDQNLR